MAKWKNMAVLNRGWNSVWLQRGMGRERECWEMKLGKCFLSTSSVMWANSSRSHSSNLFDSAFLQKWASPKYMFSCVYKSYTVFWGMYIWCINSINFIFKLKSNNKYNTNRVVPHSKGFVLLGLNLVSLEEFTRGQGRFACLLDGFTSSIEKRLEQNPWVLMCVKFTWIALKIKNQGSQWVNGTEQCSSIATNIIQK